MKLTAIFSKHTSNLLVSQHLPSFCWPEIFFFRIPRGNHSYRSPKLFNSSSSSAMCPSILIMSG